MASLKKGILVFLLFIISISVTAQTTATDYIEKYREIAVRHMKDYGLPASVILAISMHESANGTSKIARYLNNHFGIKGKNSSREIRSAYRGYDSVAESYQDFIAAMKRNGKFEVLFSKYSSSDYYNWVMGIQNGGYAASKLWGSQVLAIIKKYRLYELDEHPADTTKTLVAQASLPDIRTSEAGLTVYVVKAGDTLSAIAKKFGTNVKNIMSKNLLKSSKLSIGQKLTL